MGSAPKRAESESLLPVPAGHLSQVVEALRRSSPREGQVLQLAALGGLEDKEIAAQLSCSYSTVQEYWRRLMAKTGCRSKRGLMACFWMMLEQEGRRHFCERTS